MQRCNGLLNTSKQMNWTFNDGGRAAAGFKGSTRDCVVRAIAIAAQLPYRQVYDEVNAFAYATERRGTKGSCSRKGVRISTIRRFLEARGWKWTPTMRIGQGCRVHLRKGELPTGRLIVNVSRHTVAVIDGVIHDNHDCSRGGNRCVYGYWSKA